MQQVGYEPALAVNGREALEALDKQPYDLIFMDVMMPEMDGLEATQIIRERQKDASAHPNYQSRIVVIAMTAQAMQGDREKCLAAGMDDYLSKPILPKDVRAMVERWGSQTMAATAAPAEPTPPAPKAAAPKPAPKPAPPASAPRIESPKHTPKAAPPAPVPMTEPIKPEPKAVAAASAPKTETPAPAPKPAPKAETPKPAATESSEPPVEMDRLNDLTDGNEDSIRELVDLFLKQTAQQLAQLEAAVRANKAEDVRRVAHSCAGASATLGMTRFVPLLRELEKQGASGTLTNAAEVYEKVALEFKLIQQFLALQLNVVPPPPVAAIS